MNSILKQVIKVLIIWLCLVAAFAQERAAQPGVLPFELSNNHLFVQVRVNESKPLWLIFDTGAGQTMLDMRSATALNLKLGQSFQAGGAGAKPITGSFLEGATLTLPSVPGVSQPLRFALPFDHLESMEGRRVDGVLGYDFIRRFVLEVDFVRRQIRLHDKDEFNYTGQGESLPLTFKNNHPHVRATIQLGNDEAVEADCVIDLGARSALVLTRPFVEKHKLLERATNKIEAVAGRGVGGDITLQITRMPSFRLGRFEFKQPIVGLSQDTHGALGTNAPFEINVGCEVMRRFTIFLDYSRSRMILESNAQLGEPFEYDMSGAALEAEGAQFETIKVVRVSANSPAAQAGLQVGDLLATVDGKPVAEIGLSALRRSWLQEGTCKLTIKRGDKSLPIRLPLKRRV